MSEHTARWVLGALIVVLVGVVVITLVGCCCLGSAPVRQAARPRRPALMAPPDTGSVPIPPASLPDTVTFVQMQNVHFRFDETLALRVHRLVGVMRPCAGWKVIQFGNPRSFVIQVSTAEAGLRTEDLRYLLNAYVFGFPEAPLTIHKITTKQHRLRLDGTLHKLIDIPFDMTAALEVTPEGWIRLHPVEMEIAGLPGKGLLNVVNLQLDELLDLKKAEGVRVEGNNLLLNPTQVLPPPAIEGQVTDVRVAQNALILSFDAADGAALPTFETPVSPKPTAENYMFFRGGTLRFGKLFMEHADLQILDADPQDLFDFFLARYEVQLVAGYAQILQDFGLKVYMPDYEAIGVSVSAGEQIGLPADSVRR